jgi:MFS family permease
MSETNSPQERRSVVQGLKRDRLKLHTFWNSLANNVASPFVGFNVTSSGASDILVGYVQAISSLASAVSQLAGGWIADRTGKRVAITVLFSVVTGVLWVGTAFIQSTTLLAISFTVITLAIGFYSAGWTSVVGEAAEGTEKGAFLSSFARLTNIGALFALVLTTLITAFYPSYTTLYLLSGAFFVLSAIVLRGKKEQPVERKTISGAGNANLRKYYVVSGVYGLFWGFAWPLFTITLVKIVKMDLFQYSLSQVIGVGATIAFQPLVGQFVDRDRKRGVFWGRMGLVAYPLCYMFFSAPWQVYLVNAFSGITNALLNIAFVAYLYDISPAGQRGRYSAEFNLITGITTMAGSLIAAYTLSILSAQNTLWLSLAYLYIIAAVGRGAAAFLHLKLPYRAKNSVLDLDGTPCKGKL